MIKAFESAEYVVTPSGSCKAMFLEYPHLLKKTQCGQQKLRHLLRKHMN